MTETTHNLDQHMSNLREMVAQGKKRIGILIGAGAPASIKDGGNKPLIPMISDLTKDVKNALDKEKAFINTIIGSIDKKDPNIEDILSKIRALSAALEGFNAKIGEYDRDYYNNIAEAICKEIGKIVNKDLPSTTPPNQTPYNHLASWIDGTDRPHAIEVFTTNYDLLMEQAFETAKIPFFAGFTGTHEPFFDTASIDNNDKLPSRWARLWKLHGSLGWGTNEGGVICGCGRDTDELIYPDHLKYDTTQKLPYIALHDRLRAFLATEDTVLLSCGFSYSDSHISAVIDGALSGNPKASVFAFMYNEIKNEPAANKLASKRSNFSVYASDKAIISGIEGKWKVDSNKNSEDWKNIRDSFFGLRDGKGPARFTLGDFKAFAEFLALSKASQMYSLPNPDPKLALPAPTPTTPATPTPASAPAAPTPAAPSTGSSS